MNRQPFSPEQLNTIIEVSDVAALDAGMTRAQTRIINRALLAEHGTRLRVSICVELVDERPRRTVAATAAARPHLRGRTGVIISRQISAEHQTAYLLKFEDGVTEWLFEAELDPIEPTA